MLKYREFYNHFVESDEYSNALFLIEHAMYLEDDKISKIRLAGIGLQLLPAIGEASQWYMATSVERYTRLFYKHALWASYNGC